MSKKRKAARTANARPAPVTAAPALNTAPAFDADQVALQRRMRFNPLRMLTPEMLSMALDQFDIGILRHAGLLWDAMMRRDDTLSFVVPQLENSIAGKPWGVFKKKGADPVEAARHAAALEYFYGSVTAVNAFDRNERGDRHLLLKQMSSAYAYRYAVHHFVWRPEPGKMIKVEGGAPVPALSAEMEFVPLWYFETTTGALRFLPFGGFGVTGQPMNFQGEWMCTSGPGMMFAASICYVFKRLTFQDWTIFNERYSQQKVLGQTPESKDSPAGQAMADMVANFNGDQGIVQYGAQPGSESPIKLLGPSGTVSVDLFERFLDRQDRKMTVMFRGSDLRNMSREKDTTGVSAQTQETDALELAHCASIASACREFIDRAVIRYCFGEGVEPLAHFGLPDMDKEDAQQLRESAGFLADRGVLVDAATVAERLGVTTTEEEEDALRGRSAAGSAPGDPREPGQDDPEDPRRTENAASRLEQLINEALRTGNGDRPGHEFHGNQWAGSLPDEHWTGTPKEMHERAEAIMRTFTPVEHPKLGAVRFSRDGRDKTLHEKRTPHEFQSVQALPDLVRHGRWTGSSPDRKRRRDVVAFHKIEAGLTIGTAAYRAEVLVKETASGEATAHKFYLHRLHEK